MIEIAATLRNAKPAFTGWVLVAKADGSVGYVDVFPDAVGFNRQE